MGLKLENTVALEALPGKELEELVDEDIEQFNKFWVSFVDNSALTGLEISLLKTYVWWKTHPPKDSGEGPSEDTDA